LEQLKKQIENLKKCMSWRALVTHVLIIIILN
jgi:hypothetical protein